MALTTAEKMREITNNANSVVDNIDTEMLMGSIISHIKNIAERGAYYCNIDDTDITDYIKDSLSNGTYTDGLFDECIIYIREELRALGYQVSYSNWGDYLEVNWEE